MLALGLGLPTSPLYGSSYDPIAALGSDLAGYFEARRPDSMNFNGGAASEWRCLKTGYAVQQATGAAQPAYSANGFNGDPCLTFDGVDDCLLGTNHPYPIGTTPCEIWSLLSQDAPAADAVQRYAIGYGEGSAYQRTISRSQGAGPVNRARTTIGNGTTAVGQTHSADFSSRHVVRQVLTATDVVTWIDGVAMASSAVVPDVRATRFRLGSFINTGTSNFWWGRQAAHLITAAPLSSDKAAALQAWLMDRRRL